MSLTKAEGQKAAEELAEGSWKAIVASATDLAPWQAHYYLVELHGKMLKEIAAYEKLDPADYGLPAPTKEETMNCLLLIEAPDEVGNEPGVNPLEGWTSKQIIRVEDAIAAWTEDERKAVSEWAMAIHYRASDNDDVKIPPMPECVKSFYPSLITNRSYNGA